MAKLTITTASALGMDSIAGTPQERMEGAHCSLPDAMLSTPCFSVWDQRSRK